MFASLRQNISEG